MESKLQIISGMYRGRKLRLPPNARPTQNRARIALFNIIGSIGIVPKIVWDAFAGSGAFGIECMSRWPDCNAIFTDIATDTVIANLRDTDIGARGRVVRMDAVAATDKFGRDADLIFIDPPYAAADLGVDVIRRLAHVVRMDTIIIWEQDDANAVGVDANIWEILRDKKYGRARFLIFRRRGE